MPTAESLLLLLTTLQNNGHESGIGENSGPQCKDHVDKAVTNFVDIIKVARAQHLHLKGKCIQASNSNSLLPILTYLYM